MVKKNSTIWMCESCGNEASSWSGRCTFCGQWNTLKEINIQTSGTNSKSSKRVDVSFEKLSTVQKVQTDRLDTKIGEFNRVLGGGIVPGSIILLGGEPGIGKSTLLLQLANNIKDTFYLSAEESIGQIKVRADRLKIKNDDIYLLSESDLESVIIEIKKQNPKLVIVDSIQTVFLNSFPASAGSITQVRECGIVLQQLAKSTGIPIIIIGHVTKDGTLAGPRILEHLVDVVLYLEGERFYDGRILRGMKNRFGATDEVGIFAMNESGMQEISNPSEIFLSERQSSPGSVVTAVMEGTRPMLVEIQALAIPTNFGYPKRTTSGFDLNRLNLLAAVISKKTKINLGNYDVYINVIGGIKVSDPAIDLAVCAAMISSARNKSLPDRLCLFGEVGLSGEIRKVVRQKDREKEALKLGYELIKTPKNLSDIVNLLNI